MVAFVVCLFRPSAGEPQQTKVPSEQGILRIETGMHNDTIRRIGLDRERRSLVTGSDDKTVRVWNLKDGTLVKTLRPPIGSGNEGRIYAVAISPDGKTVAAVEAEKYKPGPMGNPGLGQLSYDKGMPILVASQAADSAWAEGGYSLLTYALAKEGIEEGKAAKEGLPGAPRGPAVCRAAGACALRGEDREGKDPKDPGAQAV